MSVTKPIIQKLKVYGYTSSAYTNFSQQAYSWLRDTFNITHVPANGDLIYLGRPKAFNCLYFNITTPQTNPITLIAKYWNGTAWTPLTILSDDTKGFTRSGFIRWDKMAFITGASTDWSPTTVNSDGDNWYYITLQASGALSGAVGFTGIGLVFADDTDLKSIQYNILNYLPKDETGTKAANFIAAHAEAKRILFTWLREAGLRKFSVADGNYWDLDEWDFHDTQQIRTCAAYLALHVIQKNMIVSKDDIYDKKSKAFYSLAKESVNLPLLSMDMNDDGYEGIEEKNASFHGGTLTR